MVTNIQNSIKAILFDLDETLLDRSQSLLKFCQWQAQVYFKFGPQMTQDFVQRFIVLDARGSVWKDQVYTQLKQEFPITESVDELVLIYLEQFQHFCIANPEVHHSIVQLYQQGYKLGLISNGKTPFQENNFKSLKLEHYFSSIIVSEAVNLRKPDAAIFQLACKQLNVEASQCIFIGDNEIADVQGSKNAGMYSIWYNRDLQTTSKVADKTIYHFSELISFLTHE